MTIHGDLYYEGKEFETRLKEKKPGDLSDDLRTALGMPVGSNAHKVHQCLVLNDFVLIFIHICFLLIHTSALYLSLSTGTTSMAYSYAEVWTSTILS